MMLPTTPQSCHEVRRNAPGSPGGKVKTAGSIWAGLCTPIIRGTGVDDELLGLAKVNFRQLAC